MTLAKSHRSRSQSRNRPLTFQPLEPRLALAASVGWDGPGLGSAQLTYNIVNTPSSLTRAEATSAIEKALSVWSSVANIKFTPTTQRGLANSLDISFTRIDGPGRTLAQAYFPKDINPARIAGDVQFDTSEAWEIGNAKGSRAFDLVWVAVHEIGHSLGLDHINVAGAVLAPTASATRQFVSLSNADISAIQRLYARASGAVATIASSISGVSTASSISTDEPSDPTDTGDSDNNPFPKSRWRRGGDWHHLGDRLESDSPQDHNLYHPTDVNGDSFTSPVDVLQVINFLQRSSSIQSDGETVGLCDTNGDGEISPIDVLTVINALTRGADSTTQSAADSTDVDSTQRTGTETEDDTDTDDEGNDCDTGSTDVRFRHPGIIGLGKHSSTQLLDRFDENADEKLVVDEVPSRLWSKWIDQGVDADDDGSITLGELNTAITAARTAFFNELDADANGMLVESEVSARFWSRLSPADSDADSNVSFAEFDAWFDDSASTTPSLGHDHHHHSDAIFASIGRHSQRH